MDRIQTSNKQDDKFGPGKPGFSAGNPTLGVLATYLSNTWCDGVQEEVLGPVEAAGLVPTGGDLQQLLTAISRLAALGTRVINTAGATNLTADDVGLVMVDATAGNMVVNLPAADAFGTGYPIFFRFVRLDNTSNTVEIRMIGADTFAPGGITLAALATNPCYLNRLERLDVMSNGGAAWFGQYIGTRRYAAFPGGGSAHWTCPPFITSVDAKLWAGGGSGGACSVASGAGGGGGGGGYARVVVPVTPGSTYAYTVGAGGAARTGAASGLTGGSTSIFGVTVTGGAGGVGSGGGGNSGGAGGTASGASFSVQGTYGGAGYPIGSAWAGGIGGGSFGGASISSPNVGAAGIAGAFPGGGGNGGAGVNNSGDGGNGLIELEF